MNLIRPYLAIIIDSFHSALASRVLWAAMIAIWLLLGSLAPIGLREDYTTKFRWFDVYNGTRMKALLAQGMVDPQSKGQAIGRVAAAMPAEMRTKLRRVGEGDEVRIRVSLLTDALNELVESDADREPDAKGWYDPEAWQSTVRLRELRELDGAGRDELSESLQRRRARLRIEAALPGVFEARSARAVLLTYAGLDFPTEFQVDRVQFETIFNQFVIPIMVNWLLGLVLVFLGVLVTASIVPDMLQTGSLHLLLSKPISRWALIVSKFIGGCAFVLLCVTQLVFGLYWIAAIRLGVWNSRILWCIPVALLIFAVFYSVSVLAGLKWRSSIISIAAAGGLAAVCTVVGIIGGVVDARVVAPDRIVDMTMVNQDLFAVTGGSGLVRMDNAEPSWVPVIDGEAMNNDRILAPVALDDDRVMTARIQNGRFNPFGSGWLDLIVLSRDDQWKPQPTLRLPTATERLFLVGDEVVAVNTADLLVTSRERIVASVNDPPDESENSGEENGSTSVDAEARTSSSGESGVPAARSVGSWLRALVTMQGGATEDFTSILPPDITLSPPARIMPIRGESTFILLTADRLYRLEKTRDDTAPWRIAAKAEISREVEQAAPVVVASSKWVVIGRGEMTTHILDAKSLQPRGQWTDQSRQAMADGTPIEMIAIAPDRFLYRTTSGHVDIIEIVPGSANNASSKKPAAVGVDAVTLQSRQRLDVDEVESVLFDHDLSSITIAHHIDRIDRFRIDESNGVTLENSITPNRSVWRWVDHYLIGSLQWLTPQVLQLGDTTAAMVSGNQSMVIGGGNWGEAEVVRYRIAGPILSCVVFIVVVMLIACWYFQRTDF